MSVKIPPIAEISHGVILTIYVQPNAKRTRCVGLHGDALKIQLASRPIDGAANEALCRFLSRQLDVPLSHIAIRSGHYMRRKRLFIRGCTSHHVIRSFKLDQ